MSTVPESSSPFEPPGPGSWSLDTAHFPRPATRFTTEVFADQAARGFSEATARYGVLLDYIEWAFVRRWAYLCPRPFGFSGPERPLTRRDWDELVESRTPLQQRLAVSSRVFEDKSWREEVRLWHDHIKPALRWGHLELQAVDPTTLDGDALWAHLDRCRDNLRRSIYHHHCLNVAPVIPAGDFLVHAQEWTGRPPATLIPLLGGDGPLSLEAADELARLAEALRADPAAGALLSAGDAGSVLDGLAAHPGPVGQAVTDYLDMTGHWSVGSGSDVGEPCLREMPDIIVGTIRALLDSHDGDTSPPYADHEAEIRAEVPKANRRAFDELMAEARASHRLRDERATYCDVWAYGLARRAILAAGQRLAGEALVEQPEQLVEAGHAEIRSLLQTGSGPSAEELAARSRYRQEASDDQAPVVLGGPPPRPVSVEWLPTGAARTERAFRAYVAAMSADTEPSERPTVRGLAASPGTYTGPARVVRDAAQLAHVRQGDVVVAGSTSPAFNVVLSLVGGVVTDHGGLLSHAAIVAREYGIPAVVGTGDATRVIPDGAIVVVDGAMGEVVVRP